MPAPPSLRSSVAGGDSSSVTTTTTPTPPPPAIFFPRLYSPRLTPLLLVISVTGSTILQTLWSGALTIALPTIGKQLNLTGQNLQWPLTLFSLFQGAFLLMAGALSDLLGRRLFFTIGIVWLAAISLAIAFVRDSATFIALNSLLGFGCAILSPSATGLLATIQDPKLRNWSYSALGAGQPLGFVVGLFAAGFLAERWRVIAYMYSGGAFLFLVTAILSLPAHDPAPHAQHLSTGQLLARFDWMGAFLSVAGLILLTFALADAGASPNGWKTPYIPALLPLSACFLAGWALWEHRLERRFSQGTTQVSPLLPLTIFKAPTLSPLLGVIFLLWAAFNVFSYFATLWIQEVQRLDSLDAAVRFVPMIVAGLVYNVVAGFAMNRVHALWMIVIGGLGGAGSCLILAVIKKETSYWAGLFPAFILTVLTDLVFPCAQLQAVKSVGPARAALAGGLFSTTTRLATSLGLALTATISGQVTTRYVKEHASMGSSIAATSPSALVKGYQAAMWFCFACSLLGVAVACVWLRGVGIVGDSVAEKRRGNHREDAAADEHKVGSGSGGGSRSSIKGQDLQQQQQRRSSGEAAEEVPLPRLSLNQQDGAMALGQARRSSMAGGSRAEGEDAIELSSLKGAAGPSKRSAGGIHRLEYV